MQTARRIIEFPLMLFGLAIALVGLVVIGSGYKVGGVRIYEKPPYSGDSSFFLALWQSRQRTELPGFGTKGSLSTGSPQSAHRASVS